MVQFKILEEQIPYTGRELCPHWGLQKTGVYGSLITAFLGPCEVSTQCLVDWEDRLKSSHIKSQLMLHFIGEFFGVSLAMGVFYQRLLMVWAKELLWRPHFQVGRDGDDLYVEQKKLSVSIATVSPVSALIHWGFNVNPTGAPVPAIGFNHMGWGGSESLSFAKDLLTRYIEELEEIQIAQCKVRPV